MTDDDEKREHITVTLCVSHLAFHEAAPAVVCTRPIGFLNCAAIDSRPSARPLSVRWRFTPLNSAMRVTLLSTCKRYKHSRGVVSNNPYIEVQNHIHVQTVAK